MFEKFNALVNEPMSAHTSFRIGGPAAAFVVTENEEELSAVLGMLSDTGAEHLLVGNGSNILVADEGYPGVIVRLSGDFESIEQDEDDPCLVRVGAARLMSSTSAFLTGKGLAGFEFASGIPGSIGGADIKFFTCMGLICGRTGIVIIFILTTLMFAVYSAVKIAAGRGSIKDRNPMLPSACAAVTVYFLFLFSAGELLIPEL